MGKFTDILVSSVPLSLKKISYAWSIPEYKVPEVGAFEPLSTRVIKDVVHPGTCMIRLLLVSEMIN